MISHTLAIFVFPYLPARGLKTFTSKNDFWRGIQKPLAAMSSRCSSLLIVLFPVSVSPAIGCRTGSTLTSLHTCDNIFAVMSRMVLWRNVTKPPFLHDMDCSGSTRILVWQTSLLVSIPDLDKVPEWLLVNLESFVLDWECGLPEGRSFLAAYLHKFELVLRYRFHDWLKLLLVPVILVGFDLLDFAMVDVVWWFLRFDVVLKLLSQHIGFIEFSISDLIEPSFICRKS